LNAAVESFSKLADSIYFQQTPAAMEYPKGSHAISPQDLPQLFVNQFASSSLHWRELGLTVKQQAVLYGDDSVARVRFDMHIQPNGSGSDGKDQAQFVLNLRIPG
jgi:hypothetical protein